MFLDHAFLSIIEGLHIVFISIASCDQPRKTTRHERRATDDERRRATSDDEGRAASDDEGICRHLHARESLLDSGAEGWRGPVVLTFKYGFSWVQCVCHDVGDGPPGALAAPATDRGDQGRAAGDEEGERVAPLLSLKKSFSFSHIGLSLDFVEIRILLLIILLLFICPELLQLHAIHFQHAAPPLQGRR